MFSKFLRNLNIRAKLIGVLILPVLTILYFSISGIYQKSLDFTDAKKSLELVSISIQLDNLIHELQKERGLSAGYIGGGAGQKKLYEQRLKTDDKVKIFSQGLNNYYQSEYDIEVAEMLFGFQEKLKILPAMRITIDMHKDKDLFEDYSQLISTSINIIQQLQVTFSNLDLSRQSNAFTILLSLQEYSGRERGMLNYVFSSGQFDTAHFNDIAGYILIQERLLENFFTVASPAQKALLQKKMNNTRIREFNELRTAAINMVSRNYRLNILQSVIGYGGLIHNFKNYVIRGKQRYVDRFNEKFVTAINTIDEYQKLPGMSEYEIDLLNTIKETFLKYKSLLITVKKLRKEGKGIIEVDSVVKVDDRPALNAIEYLTKSATGLDTSNWWEKATTRIQLIREASNSVRSDILFLARENLQSVTYTLYLYLTLTIISLMISFLLVYFLIRYLIGGIINIENHMSKMQEHGEFDKLLIVNGTDEINKVAKAFNNLITERGKLDEQLILSGIVFDKASEAMVVTDENNRFIMVNPAFTEITGYSLNEVIGKSPKILQSGKQDKKFYQEMLSSLRENDTWSGEILSRRKNGEIFPEWLNINIIRNNNGKVIKHIAIFSDITERKQYEEKQVALQRQLLQAQKMESIGQLTGGIAHDFNNMLSAILGYTELAIETKNDKTTLKNYLHEVMLAGNRAKDLVVQLLTYSRGGKDTEFQLVEMASLLNESINMIRPVLPSTIEFVSHISNDIAPIMVNPVMVNQVVMNLCINARDAIGEHGRIDFCVSSVSINNEVCSSCHQVISGEFLEVSIKDTGSGIESMNINNLFDPFFTTKEMGNEKGTGMGLAMVHGILHEHNGHIIVESTPGKGSNFRLLFPLASVKDISENKKHSVSDNIKPVSIESTHRIKGRNILLVDDEEAIVMLMTEVLKNNDYEVTGFIDSEQALSHFKENKNKYDLLITDQTMPKVTGVELSKEITQLRPDIPVILCSGYSDSVDTKITESVGINTSMTKPVAMNDLLNNIVQLTSTKT